MKKGIWKYCIFIFASLIFISTFVGFFFTEHYEDFIYRKGFVDNGQGGPYTLNIPLHEADLYDAYGNYFDVSAIGYPEEWVRTVVLPCDVEYYNLKEDKTPTLVLEKGQEVYVISSELGWFPTYGYGLQCWPDYEKGWRYGKAFYPVEVTERKRNHTNYYVKEEQLRSVAEAFGIDKANIVQLITLMDQRLYQMGAFCAPRVE